MHYELGRAASVCGIPDPFLQERAVAEAHAALGDAAFEEAHAEGRAMTFEQAVAYALEDEASST